MTDLDRQSWRLERGVRQLTGDEGMYLPNCQINLIIVNLELLSVLFWHFISTTAYHIGRYEPSCPSIKELHDMTSDLAGT